MLRKFGWQFPLFYFGAFGGRGKVFDEGVPSTQKMNSFVYTMWFWTSVLSDYQGSDIIECLSMLSVV